MSESFSQPHGLGNLINLQLLQILKSLGPIQYIHVLELDENHYVVSVLSYKDLHVMEF